MLSKQKIKIQFLILLASTTLLACSGDDNETMAQDAGLDVQQDVSQDVETDTTAGAPTAAECESKADDEAACVAIGCTFELGYSGVTNIGESTCQYDALGQHGFCLATESDGVSNVVTTYVRAVDNTHDEAMMLPHLLNNTVEGWTACSEAIAANRPGCICDYGVASNP